VMPLMFPFSRGAIVRPRLLPHNRALSHRERVDYVQKTSKWAEGLT
jgi:hypothetical protein